jgi:hypothetical protein
MQHSKASTQQSGAGSAADHVLRTFENFRVVYDPKGDARRPFLVERQDVPGKWEPEPTYKAGPARFACRQFAENCAWNLEHFASICAGRSTERPTK